MSEQHLKIAIIGGVAGGATAAAKARRENEFAEITVFERGPYVSFANCGLPYYLGGDIKERSKLFVQSPEGFWNRYRVKALVKHEVLSVDRTMKILKVQDLSTGNTFDHAYDKLILAPGTAPVIPNLPGITASNVFVVKTVPDIDKIREFMNFRPVNKVVIIGAGFIGLETAEAFIHQKKQVTVVEMMDQVLPPFDADMAKIMENHLLHAGVQLVLKDGVKGFTLSNENLATEVELQSGRKVGCDLVILSIGVRGEVKLAKDCGLTIGVTGGIEVNEFQQTSDSSIYAVGDAVQVKHLVTGKPAKFALAGPANKQGRVAGINAALGNRVKYPGAVGTCIVECLGATMAMTGVNERQCRAENIPYVMSIVHPNDHAGYYPGAHMMHIKLIVHKETRQLLGAQIAGETGVDKRIDVIATAITGHMTVDDIENLDLAYSPQYSSAQDPVVIAAFSTLDQLRGEVTNISYAEFVANGGTSTYQLVDVRTPSEFKDGHVEGAKLLSVDSIRDNIKELSKDKEVVVYCKIGMRGYIAARILQQNGFKVRNLTGGWLSIQGLMS